ncbi:sulfite exporter TauE/SafE family protein [Undibacterium sp. FT137W]|uniref:Probable membrane transporter protein n=1 Tax=Undibacterium fentianense TaxID=2828728 RepID=A0A941E551_9BURK|nr:sulfite exporter TauE/SafE family protein [Undibacterium fentianense]
MFVILLIGLAVGLIMGLTGAGGGMLAIPALVYSQGWSMQAAMPVALLAVSLGALIGAIDGLRQAQVRYKAAMLMALVGAPMTSVGVMLAQRMSQRFLMSAFAVVLCIVVARLVAQVRQPHGVTSRDDVVAKINQHTGKFDWSWTTATIISLIGACAGFATGLLGVGGGFIIVPLLRHFTNLSMQSAAATSLMVITLVGSIAVTSAVAHGAELPILISLCFSCASVLGVLAGRRLANFLPAATVQLIFAGLLLAVAFSFFWRAWF